MRKRWKQAGLILLIFLALVLADAAGALLLRKSSLPPFAVLVALAIVSIAIYLAAVKWIERRVVAEFSLRHALPELGGGFLGGAGLISGAITILWLIGVYRPEGWGMSGSVGHSVWQLAVGSMYYLGAAAIPEEILFRGLLFRMCSKIVGTWGALFVSAVAFGAVHSGAGAPLAAQLSIMLSGGVVLGAAYAATGRLWLPIGLHWGFDFTEDKVFGAPTPGHIGSGLIVGQVSGPNILTGGVWGVDASIVTIVLCFAIAIYLLWRTLRLHRIEPPIWSDVDSPSGGVA
jgi:hypothetical protein